MSVNEKVLSIFKEAEEPICVHDACEALKDVIPLTFIKAAVSELASRGNIVLVRKDKCGYGPKSRMHSLYKFAKDMSKTRVLWTEEEKRFVREHPNMRAAKIAKELGKSACGVYEQRKRLGIRKFSRISHIKPTITLFVKRIPLKTSIKEQVKRLEEENEILKRKINELMKIIG